MYKYKELLDLSNFRVSSKYFCKDNKKVVGKMKDEYSGKPILKFAGLKSKMYSILDESSDEKSTNKGHNALYRISRISRHTISEKDSQTHNERNKV